MAETTETTEMIGEPIIMPPQPTGRRIITFQPGVGQSDIVKMVGKATAKEPVTADSAGSMFAALQQVGATDAPLVLERFGLAVVGGGIERANNAASMLAGFDEVVELAAGILAVRARRTSLGRRCPGNVGPACG